jgi:integrase/recombinase XerC
MDEIELRDTLVEYSDYLVESGLSELTVKNYLADLKHLASWLSDKGSGSVLITSGQDIEAYRMDLVTNKAHPAATVNRRLQAIRKFFRYAVDRGLVDADPTLGIKLLPQSRSEGPRGLDRSEVERLLDAVKQRSSRLMQRDYAIIQVLLQTGIRVGELTRLRVTDIQLSGNGGLLRIEGKGTVEAREVPLNGAVREAIAAYLTERAGFSSDHLFLSVQGGPLSTRSVQRLVGTYAEAAGLKDVCTYTLRQTCGQQLLKDTGDLHLVARLLGHKRLETAIKYIVPKQLDSTEVVGRSPLNS